MFPLQCVVDRPTMAIDVTGIIHRWMFPLRLVHPAFKQVVDATAPHAVLFGDGDCCIDGVRQLDIWVGDDGFDFSYAKLYAALTLTALVLPLF